MNLNWLYIQMGSFRIVFEQFCWYWYDDSYWNMWQVRIKLDESSLYEIVWIFDFDIQWYILFKNNLLIPLNFPQVSSPCFNECNFSTFFIHFFILFSFPGGGGEDQKLKYTILSRCIRNLYWMTLNSRVIKRLLKFLNHHKDHASRKQTTQVARYIYKDAWT